MFTEAFLRRRVVWTCVALAALASAGLGASTGVLAQSPPPLDTRTAQVDALFAAWSGPTTPGCAVAVHQDGTLAYMRTFGMADLEHGVPLASDSIFDVASISKQFTAFAIVLLANDGKLSLADDIRKYIPELPDYGRTITLSHLMHHTSGVRENGYLLNLAGWRSDDVYTEADKLWAIVRQQRTNFAPGDEVLYGNSAYDLLREVVRRASGTSLKAFAQARIFAPLGMHDTRFGDDHLALVPRRAQGYGPRDGGGWLVRRGNSDAYGPGGLLTTVPDLLKWQTNLVDGRVGGMHAITWMRTSGRLNDGTATTYGGGLRLRDYRGLRTVGHDGLTGGFRADTVLFPDHRLGIIVLCNTAAAAAEELSLKIADVYLGERMSGPDWAPAVTMPEPAQSALAGAWWSPLTDEIVRLEWREGALRQVGSPAAFVPVGNDTFRPGESRSRWQFVAAGSAAGTARELRIFDAWPTYRPFVRLSDPVPAAAALNDYAGEYRSGELETTYTVRVAAGTLNVTWPRGYEMALDAVGGDRFVGSRGTVTFTRDRSRRIDGLTVSNRRLRRFHAPLDIRPKQEQTRVGCRPVDATPNVWPCCRARWTC
jgi:CubicO group peptidase (beta-lactamase class C family)